MRRVEIEARAAERSGASDFEKRFRRAGVPLFDESFSASTDVFNRAAPLLAAIFLAEMLGAVSLEWSLLANVGAVLGALGILLIANGLLQARKGRPFWSLPEDVGTTELAAFVFVPALLPLIFGVQQTSAGVTALANAGILLLVWAVLGFGLPWILLWVLRRVRDQLAASLMLLARAVPLLLIFALLSFTNEEMWEIFSEAGTVALIAVGLLFLSLGTGFLFARLPQEVRRLETSMASQSPPLRPVQRFNVGLVMFVSQAVQVLTVSLMVFAFFAAFGLVAIGDPIREAWIESGGDVLINLTVFGESFQLTSELLKVAGGLAAFSGLYFAVAMLTDSTYREEFLEELTSELRDSFRLRDSYLKQLGAEPGS